MGLLALLLPFFLFGNEPVPKEPFFAFVKVS